MNTFIVVDNKVIFSDDKSYFVLWRQKSGRPIPVGKGSRFSPSERIKHNKTKIKELQKRKRQSGTLPGEEKEFDKKISDRQERIKKIESAKGKVSTKKPIVEKPIKKPVKKPVVEKPTKKPVEEPAARSLGDAKPGYIEVLEKKQQTALYQSKSESKDVAITVFGDTKRCKQYFDELPDNVLNRVGNRVPWEQFQIGITPQLTGGVSGYNKMAYGIYSSSTHTAVVKTTASKRGFYHEMAHSMTPSAKFSKISTPSPTKYGRTSRSEDWADSVSHFLVGTLKDKARSSAIKSYFRKGV